MNKSNVHDVCCTQGNDAQHIGFDCYGGRKEPSSLFTNPFVARTGWLGWLGMDTTAGETQLIATGVIRAHGKRNII